MQFVKPRPFEEAVDLVGDRTPIGSAMISAEWQDVPVALRLRAFFSSEVENVRFLQRGRDTISDFLTAAIEEIEPGVTALKTGSRAEFVDMMREFALAEGMGPFDEATKGGLKDITSERRLGLIFDTQTRQANDYGYWRQGMDADVLDAFPAQRFIRVREVKQERESHQKYENQVYLKTDPIWAKVINEDFGVPWGPWAWGCGHDVEDVGRPEAEQMGLIENGQELLPDVQNFNENLRASANGLDPDLLEKLKTEFGSQLVISGDELTWAGDVAVPPAPAPAPPAAGNDNPVSDALDLQLSGLLNQKAKAAIAAIDLVHDDGNLPEIPVVGASGPSYGTFMSDQASGGAMAAKRIELKESGPWPALTAAHEIGHFLDLEAIGTAGQFATQSGDHLMHQVLAAAKDTDAVKALQTRLVNTGTARGKQYLRYLLSDVEIWARAYSQYIAEKSGSLTMLSDLKKALAAEAHRQWTEGDFKPVAEAIDKMFQQLGWI